MLPQSHQFALLQRFYPFVLGGVGLEILWYQRVCKRTYPWAETLTSLGIFALRIPDRLLSILALTPVAFIAWSHRLTTIPLDTWWGLALLFSGEELAYYWSHRADHQIRWMWASHSVHHSPERLHLASAFRLGATGLLSGGWVFFVPLYFLGLNPTAVGAMLAANLFYQFWIHSELIARLGPLEWVLNTPSHHRVHHSSNSEYLDRNFGGIVIIWDRLFRTFAEERIGAPIAYGLVHPIGSLNPIKVAFHEWRAIFVDFRRAETWESRLRSLFGRPGAAPPAR